MGTQLDWQIGEDEEEEDPERKSVSRPLSSLSTVVIVLLLVALVAVGWLAGRKQATDAEERLQQEVQAVLDEQRAALLAGDGPLFFTYYTADTTWRMRQLRPELHAPLQAGMTATRIVRNGDEVWVNASWQQGQQTYQRVLFFRREAGRLLSIPTGGDYWGGMLEIPTSWGALQLTEQDRPWAAAITDFVSATLRDLCAHGCRPGRTPLILTLAPDYALTAAPSHVRVPSPRLVALDEAGEPADLFWELLRGRLMGYVSAGSIRFAVPEVFLRHYEALAPAFEATHPGIAVEIVALETLPAEDGERFAAVDGLAFTPQLAQIAAGYVYDITDYVYSDPDFDYQDFYDQLWRSAWWQGRMWFMPQEALMPLLFYDKAAYRLAGRPEPAMRWSWTEMEADVEALAAARLEEWPWVMMDDGHDLLLSYAYHIERSLCPQPNGNCPLSPAALTAAYEWYGQQTGRANVMPDFTGLSDMERELAANQLGMAPRQVSIWVDEPVNYEQEVLRGPIGVTSFPGSELFDGVTPLWVQGSMISQDSTRPLATWEWLKFLSYQRIAGELRHIPARPSVAVLGRYWQILPTPLGDVMRSAFPFARPVTPADSALLGWEQLEDVVSGRVTPAQAAQTVRPVRWFRPVSPDS